MFIIIIMVTHAYANYNLDFGFTIKSLLLPTIGGSTTSLHQGALSIAPG